MTIGAKMTAKTYRCFNIAMTVRVGYVYIMGRYCFDVEAIRFPHLLYASIPNFFKVPTVQRIILVSVLQRKDLTPDIVPLGLEHVKQMI